MNLYWDCIRSDFHWSTITGMQATSETFDSITCAIDIYWSVCAEWTVVAMDWMKVSDAIGTSMNATVRRGAQRMMSATNWLRGRKCERMSWFLFLEMYFNSSIIVQCARRRQSKPIDLFLRFSASYESTFAIDRMVVSMQNEIETGRCSRGGSGCVSEWKIWSTTKYESIHFIASFSIFFFLFISARILINSGMARAHNV